MTNIGPSGSFEAAETKVDEQAANESKEESKKGASIIANGHSDVKETKANGVTVSEVAETNINEGMDAEPPSGSDAEPDASLNGHCHIETRDTNGNLVEELTLGYPKYHIGL